MHALVGENGAGKCDLMKILAGVHVEYDGVIRLDGAPAKFAGVQDAERAGVAIIHQELDLVPELTAADNIFLGREPLIAGTFVDRRRIVKAARALLARLGIQIDPQSRVGGASRRRTATCRNRQGAVAGRPDPADGRANLRAFRVGVRDAVQARAPARRRRESRSSSLRIAWTKSSRSPIGSPCFGTADVS